MRSGEDNSGLVSLLAWYRAMGVESVEQGSPFDWLGQRDRVPGSDYRPLQARPTAQSSTTHTPNPLRSPPQSSDELRVPPVTRSFPAAGPDASESEARAAARRASSLADLETELGRFQGCGLKATAKNLCLYRGAPQARLMIIGEAPGRDEDLAGRPFVGRAGQLLDRMLAAIGLGEDSVHITNIVYWRPPGNRTPTPQEALACRPFLERQIELVAPEFIVLLGGAAAKAMLNVADGIMRLRGKWRQVDFGGRSLPTIATLHPAYLLRTPAAKAMAWRDLLAVKARLDSPGPQQQG